MSTDAVPTRKISSAACLIKRSFSVLHPARTAFPIKVVVLDETVAPASSEEDESE